MSQIDLNAVQPEGTPVTVVATGTIGLTTFRDSFQANWAKSLRDAGVSPDSFAVSFGLFSTGYTARAVVRTTKQIVTAFQVSYLVQHLAPGGMAASVSVVAIGQPSDVVAPGSGSGVFDPILDTLAGLIDKSARALSDGLGLDFKKAGETITWAVQLALIIVVVIGAVWLWRQSQTLSFA